MDAVLCLEYDIRKAQVNKEAVVGCLMCLAELSKLGWVQHIQKHMVLKMGLLMGVCVALYYLI